MAFSNQTDTLKTPVFAQNQILRADDLNAMVAYFEEQARLTRIFTIGIGILKGLNVTFNFEAVTQTLLNIAISPGIGIASDGVLFEITNPNCEFTHYKKTSISKKAFSCDENGKRGQCSDPEESIDVYELFDTNNILESKPVDNIYTISEIDKYCVVFLLCEEEVSRKNCFNECERNGSDLVSQTKILLVKETDINASGGLEGEGNEVNQVDIIQPPCIERLGHQSNGIDLSVIETSEKLYNNYIERCIGVIFELNESFNSAYEGFSKLVVVSTNPFLSLKIWLDGLVGKYTTQPILNISDVQYCYAYFRDLILAYEEFYKTACGLTIGVNAGTNTDGLDIKCAFPGHIALGSVEIKTLGDETLPPDINCRTGFFPASANAGKNERFDRAQKLYDRLVDLVKTIVGVGDGSVMTPQLDVWLGDGSLLQKEIRITGSCTQKFGLSHQAIGYYLKLNNVQQNWIADNPDCDQMNQFITHYNLSTIPNNKLLCKMDSFDFYRIEGHLGMELTDATGKIELARRKTNLPFDIRPLLIGPDIQLENILENKELYFGEIQEVYQNTRADLLCKIEDLEDEEPAVGQNIINFKNLLASIAELSQLQTEDIKELSDFADSSIDLRMQSSYNLAKVILNDLFVKYDGFITDIKRAMEFHHFAADHPGMEHLGGVHCGGTFILVYAYRFKNASIRENYVEIYGNKSDEQLIIDALAAPNDNLGSLSSAIHKVIVADFCLPYLCCSNSPIIRNEFKDPKLQLFVENEFCYDENADPIETIDIKLIPEGGTLSYCIGEDELGEVSAVGEDLSLSIAEMIVTKPDFFTNGAAMVTLKYALGVQLLEKNVMVYKKPDISGLDSVKGAKLFDTDGYWQGFTYEITHGLTIDDVDTATLTYDGISLDKDGLQNDPIPHDFKINENNEPPNPTVKLTAAKGTCNDNTQKEIPEFCPDSSIFVDLINNQSGLDKYTVQQLQEPGYFEILPDCMRGNLVFETVILPDGMTLQGENFIFKDSSSPQLRFLFIYNLTQALQEEFGLEDFPEFPTLEQPVELTFRINTLPCDMPRTHILEIQPNVLLTIAEEVCFDQGTVTGTVAPENGILVRKINQYDPISILVPSDNFTLNLNSIINVDTDFNEGVATIEMVYIGNGFPTAPSQLLIYKKPSLGITTQPSNETIFSGNGACNIIGFKHLLLLDNPVLIDEVTRLAIQIGSGSIPEILIKDDGFVNQDYITDGAFIEARIDILFSMMAGNDNIPIKLVAENGLCLAQADNVITKVCPDAIDGMEICNPIPNNSCVPVEIDDTFTHIVNEGDPGFVELKPSLLGGKFTVFVDGTQLPPVIITSRSMEGGVPVCDSVRYFLVYNSSNLMAFLGANPSSEYVQIFEVNPPGDIFLPIDTVVDIEYLVDECKDILFRFSFLLKLSGAGNPLDNASSTVVPAKKKQVKKSSRTDKPTRSKKSKVTKPQPTKSTQSPKVSKPTTPSKSATEVLNTRNADQRATLAKLEKNKALAKTKAFGLSKSFLILPPNQITTVNTRFEEVIKSLSGSLTRAKDDRKRDLKKIITIVIHNYLDKQIVLSPKALDTTTEALLVKYIPKLKQSKLKLSTLTKSWEGESLKKALNANAVDKIIQLLK